MRILSIDAWRDPCGGWTWNQWFNRGTITRAEFDRIADSPRRTLRWLRENGALSAFSAGRVRVEDDGYNLVICSRADGEPLIALEYGAECDQ